MNEPNTTVTPDTVTTTGSLPTPPPAPISAENPDRSTDAWCNKCGHAMRYNVPRMGPAGGFVHADTGFLQCGDKPDQIAVWDAAPDAADRECAEKCAYEVANWEISYEEAVEKATVLIAARVREDRAQSEAARLRTVGNLPTAPSDADRELIDRLDHFSFSTNPPVDASGALSLSRDGRARVLAADIAARVVEATRELREEIELWKKACDDKAERIKLTDGALLERNKMLQREVHDALNQLREEVARLASWKDGLSIELDKSQVMHSEKNEEIARLKKCLQAANFGDVPKGWDTAITRFEKAEANLAASQKLVVAMRDEIQKQVDTWKKLEEIFNEKGDETSYRADLERILALVPADLADMELVPKAVLGEDVITGNKSAKDEILDMITELAALRQDKARLDWLDKEKALIDGGDSGRGWLSWEMTEGPDFKGTLRAAIDAAKLPPEKETKT